MGARHLVVPHERQLAALLAADGDALHVVVESDEALDVVAVAVLEEGHADALGGDDRLELGGRAAMETEGFRHGNTLRH